MIPSTPDPTGSGERPDALDELLGIDVTDPLQALACELVEADTQLVRDLVQHRKAGGGTVEELAARLGWQVGSVRDFESTSADPALSSVRRYALAVGALVQHRVTTPESVSPAPDTEALRQRTAEIASEYLHACPHCPKDKPEWVAGEEQVHEIVGRVAAELVAENAMVRHWLTQAQEVRDEEVIGARTARSERDEARAEVAGLRADLDRARAEIERLGRAVRAEASAKAESYITADTWKHRHDNVLRDLENARAELGSRLARSAGARTIPDDAAERLWKMAAGLQAEENPDEPDRGDWLQGYDAGLTEASVRAGNDLAALLAELGLATPTTDPAPAAADGSERPHEAVVDNAVAGALLDVYGFVPLDVRYDAAKTARAIVERWFATPGPVYDLLDDDTNEPMCEDVDACREEPDEPAGPRAPAQPTECNGSGVVEDWDAPAEQWNVRGETDTTGEPPGRPCEGCDNCTGRPAAKRIFDRLISGASVVNGVPQTPAAREDTAPPAGRRPGDAFERFTDPVRNDPARMAEIEAFLDEPMPADEKPQLAHTTGWPGAVERAAVRCADVDRRNWNVLSETDREHYRQYAMAMHQTLPPHIAGELSHYLTKQAERDDAAATPWAGHTVNVRTESDGYTLAVCETCGPICGRMAGGEQAVQDAADLHRADTLRPPAPAVDGDTDA